MSARWHLGGVFRRTDSTAYALWQYVVFGAAMLGFFYAARRMAGHRLVRRDEFRFLASHAMDEADSVGRSRS